VFRTTSHLLHPELDYFLLLVVPLLTHLERLDNRRFRHVLELRGHVSADGYGMLQHWAAGSRVSKEARHALKNA